MMSARSHMVRMIVWMSAFLELRFAGLDEVDVFRQQADVEHEQEPVLVADLADFAHVGDRERLSADQIGAGFHADVGHVLLAACGDQGFEFGDVHVALEGEVALDLERFVGEQLSDPAACQLNVGLGGGEVKVHRHHAVLAHEDLADDVLGGTALMHRQEVLGPEDLDDRLVESGVGSGAGVGVIGDRHRGDLLIAHGVRAAVREHVEEDVAVLQQERVEAGALDGFESFLDRQ